MANAASTYGTLASLGAGSLTGVIAGDTADVAGTVNAFNKVPAQVTLATNTAVDSYAEKVTALTGSAAGNYSIADAGNTIGTLTITQPTATSTPTVTQSPDVVKIVIRQSEESSDRTKFLNMVIQDIATAIKSQQKTSNGFVVPVRQRDGKDALLVEKQPPEQPLEEGKVNYVLPEDTFSHTDANATITLSAKPKGQPDADLPLWLSFNASTGQFSGTPPAGTQLPITFAVTARDLKGNSKTVDVVFGTPSLTRSSN